MIDREHVFGLRNEAGRDVRDIRRKRGIVKGYVTCWTKRKRIVPE